MSKVEYYVSKRHPKTGAFINVTVNSRKSFETSEQAMAALKTMTPYQQQHHCVRYSPAAIEEYRKRMAEKGMDV